MKINSQLSIIFEQDEIKRFAQIIDKVERHRCNEGAVLHLAPPEAKVLVKIHNHFFADKE